jgi:hypothetical protein
MAKNTNTINLCSTDIAAIAGSLKDAVVKSAKAAIRAGDHAVDVVVRVRGTLSKGKDYEQRVTAAMPMKDMLIAAVKLNGISMEKFMEQYLDSAAGLTTDITDEHREEMAEVWDRLSEKFTRTCNGKVTFKGTIDPVTIVPAVV